MDTSVWGYGRNNVELSIQIINDVSAYAKRVSSVTLHTAGVIESSISDLPFVEIRKTVSDNKQACEYLDKIAEHVENFGQALESAVSDESQWIKVKEELLKKKLFTKLLTRWEPLAVLTKARIQWHYEWFLYRIDQLSRSYLTSLIEGIQFKENKNEQQ
jgi:hypothetical protein